MSRAKPPHTFSPRLMSGFDVACYLNRSEQWLHANRPKLETVGFPRPDPMLGLYDRRAIDRWLDQRAGLVAASLAANDPSPPAGEAQDPFMAACGK